MKAERYVQLGAGCVGLLGLAALLTLGSGPHSGFPGLLAAVTFQAPFWGLTPWLGIAGATLWMVALVAVTFPEDRFTWAWTVGIAAACFVFTIPIEGGLAIPLGVPLVLGATMGSRALGLGCTTSYAVRSALGATFVGSLLGIDILGFLAGRVQPAPDMAAVIGGAGLVDGLTVAPVLAAVWVLGFGAVRRHIVPADSAPTRGPLMHRSNVETIAWTGIGMVAAVPAWAAYLLG